MNKIFKTYRRDVALLSSYRVDIANVVFADLKTGLAHWSFDNYSDGE